MSYKRKYTPGKLIQSLDELMDQEFVYLNHKIMHRGWFMSWQLRMAMNSIKGGHVRQAVKKEDMK